jgi:hypothetical protein
MQGQLVEDCRTVAGTVLDGEDEPEYVRMCQWVGGGWVRVGVRACARVRTASFNSMFIFYCYQRICFPLSQSH